MGRWSKYAYDAAPWEPSDAPVKFGNLVTLDVDGTIDGDKVADDRGVDFIPSQDNPRPFPGFSIYLEGMKKEESKEFTSGRAGGLSRYCHSQQAMPI